MRPRYLNSRDYGFWQGLLTKRLVLDEDTPCPICSQPKLIKACPLCREPLDPTTGEVDDHVIAVIGASESGKTHYLAAVMHQFLEGGAGGDAWSVDFASDDDEEIYRQEFLKPFFERREELPITPAALSPEMRLLLQHRRTGQRALLAFRDLGGEIFADPKKLEQTDFLRYAKGVVLVVDPQAFPLTDISVTQPWPVIDRPTAVEVLRTYRKVLDALGQPPELKGYPVLPEEKLLAIAVTKADMILEDDHAFYKDEEDLANPTDPGFWSVREERSHEVRRWLHSHIGDDLDREVKHFADKSYFFVSSYGFHHTPRDVLRETPRPKRVHEPILALLDRLAEPGLAPAVAMPQATSSPNPSARSTPRPKSVKATGPSIAQKLGSLLGGGGSEDDGHF